MKDGFASHALVGYAGTLAEITPSIWLREHAAGATVAMRCNSMLGVTRAVASGAGVSVVPCFLAEGDPAIERVFPKIVFAHDAWLVVHPDLRETARVRAVYDFLVELMRTERALLRGDVSS